MALYTKRDLNEGLRSEFIYKSYSHEDMNKYAQRALMNESKTFSRYKTYDVFLSHSYEDAQYILQLKKEIEKTGLSVYVDWIEDNQLDRSNVNRRTAELIRLRMKSCKTLLYALTENSKRSSWVQWELGFADGHKKGKVAIIPILEDDKSNNGFYKQEYLGLYPYVDYYGNSIFVNGIKYENSSFISLNKWLSLDDVTTIL